MSKERSQKQKGRRKSYSTRRHQKGEIDRKYGGSFEEATAKEEKIDLSGVKEITDIDVHILNPEPRLMEEDKKYPIDQ